MSKGDKDTRVDPKKYRGNSAFWKATEKSRKKKDAIKIKSKK